MLKFIFLFTENHKFYSQHSCFKPNANVLKYRMKLFLFFSAFYNSTGLPEMCKCIKDAAHSGTCFGVMPGNVRWKNHRQRKKLNSFSIYLWVSDFIFIIIFLSQFDLHILPFYGGSISCETYCLFNKTYVWLRFLITYFCFPLLINLT